MRLPALLTPLLLAACATNPPPAKPVAPPPHIAPQPADGYPTSDATAEGAACDFSRAFIAADYDAFRAVCFNVRADSGPAHEYAEFLDSFKDQMQQAKAGGLENGGGPKAIRRVSKLQHLSANGPSSAAYAFYDADDLGFVDIVCDLHGGGHFTNRTLLLRIHDHWKVIPRPDLFPLISGGLNEEPDPKEFVKPAQRPPSP